MGDVIFSIYFALSAISIVGGACVRRPSVQQTPQNSTNSALQNWTNNEEIKIFREYLRIPTISVPGVDYKPAVEFLKKQAASLDLPVSIYYPVNAQSPVVVMTWKGSQPELPSIMLNSHMDVVPVFPEYWTHPPFAAEMDEDGDIYARGAQDMKNVGMQYLAAIRSLKRQKINQLKRTIYVVYVPDEENGGINGTVGFVKTADFKAMNVGFDLDEGSADLSPNNKIYAYYGQKTARTARFTVHGNPGHGSRFFKDAPSEKLTKLLDIINEFREEEMRKFDELKYPYGNVTTINLTILKGGVQDNVVPADMTVTFDIRVSFYTDLNEFEQQMNGWCEKAGGNITIDYIARSPKEPVTKLDGNPFWMAIKGVFDSMELPVEPGIATGGVDARYLRRMNIPAINFTPLFNTTARLHDNNEYINAQVYLNGIEIYEKIITQIANV